MKYKNKLKDQIKTQSQRNKLIGNESENKYLKNKFV